MNIRIYRLILRAFRISLLVLIPSVSVFAGDDSLDAKHWLKKISQAENTLSYQGTFVYQRVGEQMFAMKIFHRVSNNEVHERLVSLNGEQSEIIRDDHGVICRLPNGNSVVVNLRGFNKVFSSEILEHTENMERYYHLSMGGASRVAGRNTRIVVIQPRDDHRYGYRIWVDGETGLLLKSQLLDAGSKILEQMMYTTIEIVDNASLPLPETLVASDKSNLRPQVIESFVHVLVKGKHPWILEWLPRGFSLVQYQRASFEDKKSFYHMVYTDGLASVSVFIEPQIQQKLFKGAAKMGAINAVGNIIDGYQVTTVGEVPMNTLRMMGDSIRLVSLNR